MSAKNSQSTWLCTCWVCYPFAICVILVRKLTQLLKYGINFPDSDEAGTILCWKTRRSTSLSSLYLIVFLTKSWRFISVFYMYLYLFFQNHQELTLPWWYSSSSASWGSQDRSALYFSTHPSYTPLTSGIHFTDLIMFSWMRFSVKPVLCMYTIQWTWSLLAQLHT